MACEEVLKVVFPMLEDMDLLSCTVVCKKWRDIARDDYFWKCLCAKKWPSIAKRSEPPAVTYYKLYQKLYQRQLGRTLLPPIISLDDLEFYIDVWTEDSLVFSEVISGTLAEIGPTWDLKTPAYKMTLPVERRFTISMSKTISISVLFGRRDSNKMASIINKSVFNYFGCKAYAFDDLDFSALYPFTSGIRAWISLLFEEGGNDAIDVFGIVMDFCDFANSAIGVLWLLDMLDWT